MEITQKELMSLFDYDPHTGIFKWRLRAARCVRVGDTAGSKMWNGYLRLRVKGRFCMAHRIAWMYVYGRNPSDQIDHIDGDRSNNRISNLREASVSENQQNLRRANCDSVSGYLGVRPSKSMRNPWVAQIKINGKQKHIGSFKTPEDAYAAYLEAKRALHPFGEIAKSAEGR